MFAHVNMYMYLSPFQNEYRFVTVYVHSAGCVDVALGGAGTPRCCEMQGPQVDRCR